ncbi:hypothetical protein EIP86_001092 [Pleurotus ostreatoroseus]|nr:hypothetical protein EIP86_001092 [Pleurotus ostreatoroseus]
MGAPSKTTSSKQLEVEAQPATGSYPDGLPLRRSYTGITILDFVFTGLAGFFSAAVDGKDEATCLFCLWFLPQLSGILTFCYWEAGRAKTFFTKSPALVSTMAQLCTAGVTLPMYFVSYARSVPLLPSVFPDDPLSRARTVLLAVAIGYGAPTVALFAPMNMSLDTRQIIAAIWQPFPIYITIIYNVMRKVDVLLLSRNASPAHEIAQASAWIRASYYACAVVSGLAHVFIALPSLFTTNTTRSFVQVFVPCYLHPFLAPLSGKTDLPEYRVMARLLFQHDWLTMTAAALLFFAWSYHMSRSASVGPWAARMVLLAMVGGPGVAIAWAAAEREGRIYKRITKNA